MLVKSSLHVRYLILKNSGITLNPKTFTTVSKGYAVSIKGLQVSTIEYFKSFDGLTRLTRNLDYCLENKACYGAWVHYNGKGFVVFQSVSMVYDSLNEALEVAKKHRQKAIYSLHENKEIYL